MASRATIVFLVTMMLVTGVCNTLLTKYQDNQCVRNCSDPDPRKRAHFEQPVLQTAQMFVGEMGCWLVVAGISLWNRYASPKLGYRPLLVEADADHDRDDDDAGSIHSRTALNGTGRPAPSKGQTTPNVLRGWRVVLLGLPAVCDIVGTTLMNGGLLLVAASIYQMTRGILVLFVGLLSRYFMRRRLHLFQWLSLVGVVLGVGLVGLAGAISPDKKVPDAVALVVRSLLLTTRSSSAPQVDADSLRVTAGVFMIACAQLFTASQFVLEEWIMEKSSIEPLEMVGWEGIFGFSVTSIGMVILHLAIGRTEAGRHGPFDIVEGWNQLLGNRAVAISSLLIMVSIGGFNFFGLSVTRSVSATSRSLIDTCRTLFIWIVSLGLGWETFKVLQVVGFGMLVYFTFVFNGIIPPPPIRQLRPPEPVEELLPEEPIEHI
ncbi:hypothetical protein VTK73DRAFT_8224 [Phialemonium thermophilum]|uniref:Integral membrane protein n=1 Tax=Phialemonium thermophilum TaxID=223376 RepID=A0ABR3W9P6_9PEZI